VFVTGELVLRSTRFGRAFGKNVIILGRMYRGAIRVLDLDPVARWTRSIIMHRSSESIASLAAASGRNGDGMNFERRRLLLQSELQSSGPLCR